MANRKMTHIQSLAVFAGTILACLILPSFLGKESFFGATFAEFRAPLYAIPSQLSDLEKFWALHSNSKTALIEAGRDLARVNAAYELRLMENKTLKAQIGRYEKILDIPSFDNYQGVVARISDRSLNAWWQRLVIRKGSLHGIKEGSAVISSSGVVGRVSEVHLYTSVVELASSPQFRMAAHFEGDDRPVIFTGAGALDFGRPIGEVRDVPEDFSPSVSKPLKLVTSSLAGTFPDGIPIGWVSGLSFASDGIFKYGTVDLVRGIESLREVLVLVKVEAEN